MSELISGKDALIAIGEGKEIEYKFEDSNGWMPQNCLTIDGYLNNVAIFRLKPRTITINGVELNQCYSVAIDYTELKVSVVLRNKEDTCVLYNLLADLYSSK